MRIGLFTDTYRPSINGIVFVVESLKQHLEEMGHEVYIFCPAKAVRPSKKADEYNDDEYIVRFPSIKSTFFDDYDMSLFFPPRAVKKIQSLDLDIVHVFTPSQIGMLGVRTAVKDDIPFIMQHSTDLYEFVEHYPAVFPGVLGLVSILLPSTVKMGRQDIREVSKFYKPRRKLTDWNKDVIAKGITILYSKAAAVIALCQKSIEQLESWQGDEYPYDITLMPSGVDAIQAPTPDTQRAFNRQYGIAADDLVFGFVGRLGEEKNLDILIPTLGHVLQQVPSAKLLFVGDFDYRETLEQKAADSGYGDRIIFTGALPREQLGVVYGAMDVFVFPSLKDTQGWVLHEAAHAGLPIVLIDKKLSEVVQDGKNGYLAENNEYDLASKITTLLCSPSGRTQFGKHSRALAAEFSEKHQVQKLEAMYHEVIQRHDTTG